MTRIKLRKSGGATALIYGAYKSLDVVKALLIAGAEVNAQTRSGQTALIIGAKENRLDIVRLLLVAGADVNAQETFLSKKITALTYAVRNNNPELVKLLLMAGADANAKSQNGMIVLETAERMGYSDIAQMLRDAGADYGNNAN